MFNPVLAEFNLPEEILFILDRLEKNNKRSYLVGGSVRDLLLSKAVHDYDITTPATPTEVKEIFNDYITLDTGLQHGTVTLLINNKAIEITTFRTDGKYSDHRRPNNVELSTSLFEDSKRRDFTINQLAYNPIEGLVDYHDGLKDLKAKLIRAVGDPPKRFNEDALRIIRALRFATQLNFGIESNTLAAVKAMITDLNYVAPERLTYELSKILNSGFLAENWTNLLILWRYLFPDSVCKIYETFSNDFLKELPQDHKINLTILCFFLETEEIYNFLNKLKLKRSDSDFILSYTSVLKDIARMQFTRDHGVSSNSETTEIPNFSSLDLIRLRIKYNFHLPTLIEILNLVAHEHSFEISKQTVMLIEASFSEIVAKQLPLSTLDLAISGEDLIKLGLSQGKFIGQVLNSLLDKVLQGELENTRKSLLAISKNMIS